MKALLVSGNGCDIVGLSVDVSLPQDARVIIALGSNLGDRKANVRAALELLAERGVSIRSVSRVYETEPVGVLEQPAFLNLAAEIETALSPLELLNVTQEVEGLVGRRPTFRWGPRVIDIDIILWGRRVMELPGLQVPHPRFRERGFVLEPLAEIAPQALDPLTGLTVEALFRQFQLGSTP